MIEFSERRQPAFYGIDTRAYLYHYDCHQQVYETKTTVIPGTIPIIHHYRTMVTVSRRSEDGGKVHI